MERSASRSSPSRAPRTQAPRAPAHLRQPAAPGRRVANLREGTDGPFQHSSQRHFVSPTAPRHGLTPPPPAECVRLYRAKYPEALVCIGCGTLLASEAKSYARSGLTEEQRLSYVCGECRWAAQEAARIKALRAEQGRVNMARLNAVRGATAGRVRGPLRATKDSANFQYRFSA